ncbi:MAG: lycopene cyclase domain-containing protein [Cellvibrionaceae bacterium]|jgi:lycopene cyclase domain-containing protein
MTYFRFLQIFLVSPLILFSVLCLIQYRSEIITPIAFKTWRLASITLTLVGIAVVWTTPWDNYLVMTAVWWYDPSLVSGFVIGYVPIEEYIFFVLQTVLTTLITIFLMRHWPISMAPAGFRPNSSLNKWSTIIIGALWLISTLFLLSGYRSTTYLTLILSWALIPIFIQTLFGADILWHYKRLLFWGIVPITLYLSAADSLAIFFGTWTISKEQTLGILLGSILPLEEFIFFLVTNTLVVFGMTLLLAQESHHRAAEYPLLKRITYTNKN